MKKGNSCQWWEEGDIQKKGEREDGEVNIERERWMGGRRTKGGKEDFTLFSFLLSGHSRPFENNLQCHPQIPYETQQSRGVL